MTHLLSARVFLLRVVFGGITMFAVVLSSCAQASHGGPGDGERPHVGVNLSFLTDWSTELPFVDVFMTSREWIPSGVDSFELHSGVTVPTDAAGWPLEIPFDNGLDPSQIVKTLMMRDWGFDYPTGTYTLIFEGDGTVEVDFAAVQQAFDGGGTYSFEVPEALGDGILLVISRSNPLDPIGDIHVILPGFAETWWSQPFNPVFLERMLPFQVFRFLNWGATNDAQTQVAWSERTLLSDARQSGPNGAAFSG